MKSDIVKSYARRMKRIALQQARAVKNKPMAHKRIQYLRDALYYRNAERNF